MPPPPPPSYLLRRHCGPCSSAFLTLAAGVEHRRRRRRRCAPRAACVVSSSKTANPRLTGDEVAARDACISTPAVEVPKSRLASQMVEKGRYRAVARERTVVVPWPIAATGSVDAGALLGFQSSSHLMFIPLQPPSSAKAVSLWACSRGPVGRRCQEPAHGMVSRLALQT